MSGHAKYLLLAVFLLAQNSLASKPGDRWVDSLSVAVGGDEGSNNTGMFSLGMQNKWERTWFNEGAWYVGGYWDVSLAHLESDAAGSANDELIEVGIAPVLRMQRDAALSSGYSPYAEFGLGAHLLSETHLGALDLSSSFQFSSQLGLGFGFGEQGRYELGYRFQRLSNADIKKPNDGIDLHLVRFGYGF